MMNVDENSLFIGRNNLVVMVYGWPINGYFNMKMAASLVCK